MNYSNLLASWRRTSRLVRPGRRARSGRRLWVIEGLEDRALLSTIIWMNRGNAASDQDNFNAVYQADANKARNIVDAAIAAWEGVIANFNYSDGSNTYSLNISASSSLKLDFNELGHTTNINVDHSGKPTSASIVLTANYPETIMDESTGVSTTVGGWYFDASPYDNGEFTNLKTRFEAETDFYPVHGENDFYSTVLHEIGHAMGIRAGLRPGHEQLCHTSGGRPGRS